MLIERRGDHDRGIIFFWTNRHDKSVGDREDGMCGARHTGARWGAGLPKIVLAASEWLAGSDNDRNKKRDFLNQGMQPRIKRERRATRQSQ